MWDKLKPGWYKITYGKSLEFYDIVLIGKLLGVTDVASYEIEGFIMGSGDKWLVGDSYPIFKTDRVEALTKKNKLELL